MQLVVFWALVRFSIRWLGLHPSTELFDAPHRVLVPVWGHAAITAGMVLLLVRVLGMEAFSRSPWFSPADAATVAACAALGMLPTVADLALVAVRRHRSIQVRPAGGAFPAGAAISLVLALIATALVEEIAFRNVPLALLGERRLVPAYLIPAVAFAGIHFLESGRARGVPRVIHLFTGALFFFAVALRYGLIAATFAHAASNLAVVMTEGNWRIGALLSVGRSGPSERHVHNSIGYVVGTLVVLLQGMG